MKPEGISLHHDSISRSEDIREAIREILQNSDYKLKEGPGFGHHPLFKWITRFFADLFKSLTELIHSIFDVSPVFGILFIGLLFAVCLLLIWHIVYTIKTAFPQKKPERDELPEEEKENPDVWENRAQQAAARQDFITAARALLYAGLLYLEQKNRERLIRGKTNREYLNKYRETSVYSPLALLVNTVEHKWYGRDVCTIADYEQSMNAFSEIKKHSGTVYHAENT